jgi:MFS family permease
MLSLPLTVLVLNTFGANRLAARIGFRWTLVLGLTCVGVGATLIALSTGATADWATLLPGMMIFAAGPGLVFAPLTTAALRRVPTEMAGAASGVLNTCGQLGGVLGSALVGFVFESAPVGADALHIALVIPLAVAVLGALACLLVMEHDMPRVAPAFTRTLAPGVSSRSS